MTNVEFINAEEQESPPLLPGHNPNAQNTLGDIVRERTTHFKKLTDEIHGGNHVVINERTNGQKWYQEQIDTMSRFGYIPQTAETYASEHALKRAIGHNPTSQFLIDDKHKIKTKLLPDIQHHVRIAGTGFANKSSILMRNAREHSLLTIAPAGDLNTMKEIIDIVDEKIREHRRNLTVPTSEQRLHERDHPLIIENIQANGHHYWDGLLRGIKILDYDDTKRVNGKDQRNYVNLKDLASVYGIYITDNREQTLKLANSLGKSQLEKSREKFHSNDGEDVSLRKHELPIVPDNSIIYVATGTRKKFDVLQDIYKKRGINVRIRPIYELTDTYVGPEEDAKTYEGNVAKKIDAAIEAWEIMDIRTRNARLKKVAAETGIDRNEIESHIFFLAEDSGIEFKKEGVLRNHRFDDIEGIDPHERHPGVETGPTVFAKHGVTEFFRKAGEVVPAGERDANMKSILALTPLKKNEFGKRPKYMVMAETKGQFITEPRPANGSIEIDNFIIPEGEKETEQELLLRRSDYSIRRSNKALAWQGLAQETGIELDGKGITDDYSKEFVIGIMAGQNRSSQIISDKLEKKVGSDGFGVIKMNTEIKKPLDIQSDVLAKSDAVVLAFDPEHAQKDFWQNMFTFMSLIVGEQTHDKYKLSKPLKLINPKIKGKGAFDYLEDMVHDFHILGTIAQDPATLYTSVGTIEQAVDELKKERTNYRRMEVPAYAKAKDPNAIDGSPCKKDFNVAIFCSATSKNTKYIKDAHDLAEGLIKSDFGLVSGAGLYSAMGAVTSLAEDLRYSEHGAHHSGSNVRHLMLVEGDARDKLDQFLLARNIYERMEFMMDNSNAFVIAPGGSGTVQEMSLLSLLKQRAVQGNDPYAAQKMGGKDIIILNSKIPYNGGNRGFYDKLIEIIPKEDFTRLGIHVVDTPEQAQTLLKELRESKRHENGEYYADKSKHSAAITAKRENSSPSATLH